MFSISKTLLRFISLILGISPTQNFPPPLSKSEEEELFSEMKKGNATARAKIIEHNLRLVSHVIRKYLSSYGEEDELLSIGSIGLIKAVDSFKSDKGTRFATYGAKCIQNEILMFFRSRKKNSQEVSINETIDIDKDGNPLTYIDIVYTEDTIAEDIDKKMKINKALEYIRDNLDDREKQIIIMRYGLGNTKAYTQREVAQKLDISRSYVSRIEKSVLEKINKYLTCDS